MRRFRDTKYLVTEDGRIWSEHNNIFLKQKEEKGGYLMVALSNNGVRTEHRVHRIVAETYIENSNNYSQVNHIDNNPKNNNVMNLEWVSPLMNSQHTSKQKRQAIGIKSGRHKLTKDQVIEIKKLLNTTTMTQTQIAKQFNVSESHISRIKWNKSRYHLEDEE